MISKKHFITTALYFLSNLLVAQQTKRLSLSATPSQTAFTLSDGNTIASIQIDSKDATVVRIAAEAFMGDMKMVTEKSMQLDFDGKKGGAKIIAGTLGKSFTIDSLAKAKAINTAALENQWECFSITVLNKNHLVIAGSDPRGTAFGIFHLSKLLGVSPFVWWADAVPEKQKQIFITGSYTSSTPSVKFRGIFLNDEDWGLQPWAAKTFEPETGDIGPKTYTKIFELLLRLKANLIWPAMHEVTRPFFTIAGNVKVAEDYAIIIGTSHAEPMLRTNTGEWKKQTMGDFNYVSNKASVLNYWEERVKESKGINAMYSMGMRGVHDSKMEGIKDAKEAVPLLDTIFNDQRNLLSKFINPEVKKVPQVFTAYKEVLEIYDNGLKLPNDITLVWPDDNYGYIQRLNNTAEANRSGGSGIYYHASYWGRPHDYLWLSSTHPSLIQEEMMKAYNNQSNTLWVLNVGDIKPLEYNIELFMDMAFDAAPFQQKVFSKQHLYQWTTAMFGKEVGSEIQSVLWEYYQLAFERRPEFMGWSQTEPTTKINYTAFNHFNYGDEAQIRLNRYKAIEDKVKVIRKKLPAGKDASFFQLVYYPVVCASYINQKFLYRDKSAFYAKQGRLSALDYHMLSKNAYDSIQFETDYFNNQLSGGKWKHMMSMQPRNLPVFSAPESSIIAINAVKTWGIAVEGSTGVDTMQLPAFYSHNQKQLFFIDVFLSKEATISWKAQFPTWLKLSSTSGTLSPIPGKNQQRLIVSIDWKKVPAAANFSGDIIICSKEQKISVRVLGKSLKVKPRNLFVEQNGYVSIFASHFHRQ